MNEIHGKICPSCKWSDISPAETCPRCHSTLEGTLFSGKGKVATFTVIRYPPKGFENESPYVVALIDLEMGPRVIGRIAASPERLRIGTEVHLVHNANGVLEFAT